MTNLLRCLSFARRHPLGAWLVAFAFYLATPFPPAEWAVTLGAQTALSSTTISAAMGQADTQVAIASTTGFTAATTSAAGYALVDRELMRVLTVNTSSKVITLVRGQLSTRAAPHISGATITFVPSAALVGYIPSGQCTRTNLQYVPLITSDANGLAGSDV